MRRAGIWPAALLAVAAITLAISAMAQQEREAYRGAYRAWRETDPNLERESAGGAAVGARADKVAASAAKYYAARKAYLDAQGADAHQKSLAIESVPAPAEFDPSPANYAAAQSATISASIETIANDPDRVIQQLRQILERERSALVALNAAVNDTQKGREAVERSSAAAEQARGKLAGHYQTLAAGLQQSATQSAEVGALWTGYYRSLAEGTRAVAAPGPVVVTLTPPVRAPVAPAPSAGGDATGNNQAGNNQTGNNQAPVQRTPTITPLPLARYIGAWNYPTFGAEYHGTQPQSVDLVVREENGQAKGSLSARFQLPQGGPVNPALRFEFEGPLQKTRNQSFPLVTSTGAKGTIELIPGPAFNLLQVNFSTDGGPGTVRQGNFLLIKK